MPELTKQEKITKLKEWLANTKLDPAIVQQNIGVNSACISANVLLQTSAKLVKINRKEVEPDNRDNLKFSTFLGLEDFTREHVEKDAGKVQKKAIFKMKQKKDLSWLHSGFFTPQIRSIVIGNSLSQNIEGINPLENYDVSGKITKMGEGGIGSAQAIPMESRVVDASQFGFFDPFHMVESVGLGVVNYACRNVRKGFNGDLYRLMLDKDGKEKWVDHKTLLNSTSEVPDF